MNIIMVGPPGSGKGTYASRIAPKLGIAHVSSGDIFRNEISKASELGKLADSYIKKGQLVPDEVTIGIIKKRLDEDDCKNGYILDGYPRTIPQAEALENVKKTDLVLNFKLDEEIIIEKTLARRLCNKCGKIYNVAHIKRGNIDLPPLLPKGDDCDCGGTLIQRKDDNIETIKDRLNIYKNQSEPLLDYYNKKGILKVIDVIGPPEVMVPIILKEIENFKK